MECFDEVHTGKILFGISVTSEPNALFLSIQLYLFKVVVRSKALFHIAVDFQLQKLRKILSDTSFLGHQEEHSWTCYLEVYETILSYNFLYNN